MKNRTRNINLHIFLSEEEDAFLEEKYKDSGLNLKSDFIRHLILDGFVVQIELSDIQRNNFLLSNIANNVNQIAHRINETRSIYQSDIDQLKKEVDKVWQLQKSMLSALPLKKQ